MSPKIDSPLKLYFYKFLKGGKKTIQVGDITLSPEYDEYSNIIYWTIDNPNDSSYSSYTLSGYIEESVQDFSQLTDKSYFTLLSKQQKLETPQVFYIKPSDEEKFLRLAQETTKYKTKSLQMDIHAFDVKINMVDSDMIGFTISIVCFNPYNPEQKQKLTYSELRDKLDEDKELDSFFEYTQNLFNGLIDYIWVNKPALFDNTYMFSQCYIRYFTPTHKEMKIW